MSYLPGLRESLLKAAREQQQTAPASLGTRRRIRFLWDRGVGTLAIAASLIAVLAVSVIALTTLRHNPSPQPSGRGGSSAATQSGRARAAIQRLLAGVVLPPGAIRSGLVRGTPAELWRPADLLQVPRRVDEYRVWRLSESPDRVINFMTTHHAAGLLAGEGSSAGESPPVRVGNGHTRPGREIVTQATLALNAPVTSAGIVSELVLDAQALRNGGTALRVDAEAGWFGSSIIAPPLPDAVSRVKVSSNPFGLKTAPRLLTITNTVEVQKLVRLLNSLPAVSPVQSVCPTPRKALVLRFRFYESQAGAPLAAATYSPLCDLVHVHLPGGEAYDRVLGPWSTAPAMEDVLFFGRRLPPALRRVTQTATVSGSASAPRRVASSSSGRGTRKP